MIEEEVEYRENPKTGKIHRFPVNTRALPGKPVESFCRKQGKGPLTVPLTDIEMDDPRLCKGCMKSHEKW